MTDSTGRPPRLPSASRGRLRAIRTRIDAGYYNSRAVLVEVAEAFLEQQLPRRARPPTKAPRARPARQAG